MTNEKLYIVTLPHVDSIPNVLRELADEIERGDYGEATEGVLALNGSGFETFSFGQADASRAHLLFSCAARKLQQELIPLEMIDDLQP